MARFNKKADGEHRVHISIRVSPGTEAAIDAIAEELRAEDGREKNRGRAVDEMARRAAVRSEL